MGSARATVIATAVRTAKDLPFLCSGLIASRRLGRHTGANKIDWLQQID